MFLEHSSNVLQFSVEGMGFVETVLQIVHSVVCEGADTVGSCHQFRGRGCQCVHGCWWEGVPPGSFEIVFVRVFRYTDRTGLLQ